MGFLDQHYLLSSPEAEEIFADIAALPIIDAHNHCDVKALAADAHFSDIWEAEAATDHYVWECMRKCGVDEALITGKTTSNREKWQALANVFDWIAGNPSYEWIHLDLRRILSIELEINAENADAIWCAAKERFALPEYSQQNLIRRMNVEAMCSTDDPCDSLEHHRALQASPLLRGRVFPTFRPDKAMNIFKPDWRAYMASLAQRWNMSFSHIRDVVAALQQSHDFFAEHGCRASDHGVEVPYGYQVDEAAADAIFQKALAGTALSQEETIAYMAYMLNQVAEMDAQKGWVFQIHIGAVRDVRASLYDTLGPDVGGDISDHKTDYVAPLLPLLNRFDGRLKVVLYNMNPVHNGTLAQLTRAFGNTVSLGLAWWLNDSYIGMKTQLEYVSSVDVFSNMAGMVSDSRKIPSYASRHEMFRRTLSSVLADAVRRGQMPLRVAKRLAARLAYERPKQLFGL